LQNPQVGKLHSAAGWIEAPAGRAPQFGLQLAVPKSSKLHSAVGGSQIAAGCATIDRQDRRVRDLDHAGERLVAFGAKDMQDRADRE
jgi:hypothetical protein